MTFKCVLKSRTPVHSDDVSSTCFFLCAFHVIARKQRQGHDHYTVCLAFLLLASLTSPVVMINNLAKLLKEGSVGSKFKGTAHRRWEVMAAGHIASAVGKQRGEDECSAPFSQESRTTSEWVSTTMNLVKKIFLRPVHCWVILGLG